jgi:hypothetical protein
LLIGKLKHEAVTLNEHLTKALRYLKKSKPGDMVDRQLVTNYLLQFLAMERSDPKKFQVLQLIAQVLAWSDGELSLLCTRWLEVANLMTRAKRTSRSRTPRRREHIVLVLNATTTFKSF